MEPAFNPFSWVLSLFTGTVFTPKRTLADDEKEWERLTEGQIREQVVQLDVSAAMGASLSAHFSGIAALLNVCLSLIVAEGDWRHGRLDGF